MTARGELCSMATANHGWTAAEANAALDRHRAEVLAEGFTPAELAMLRFALNEAQEAVWSRDGFTDEDQAALDSLRRMADASASASTSKEQRDGA